MRNVVRNAGSDINIALHHHLKRWKNANNNSSNRQSTHRKQSLMKLVNAMGQPCYLCVVTAAEERENTLEFRPMITLTVVTTDAESKETILTRANGVSSWLIQKVNNN